MPDLETVDLSAVEIMAAGERVHGRGSPPEGDVYEVADLERLAENTNALLDRVKPFVKLGHNPEQKLMRAEGFYDNDDQPQTGRLARLRVDGTKLVTDLEKVPKKLGELIASGAFPWRSTEIIDHTADGETRDAVGALAWLGAKRPAFKTLADVAALYADQEGLADGVRVVAHYASATDIWPEEESLEWLRSAVDRTLNPGPSSMDGTRYWVRDVAAGRALVCEGYGDAAPTWVVPFTTSDDGITVAPASDWVLAEQQWVDASREMAAEHERRRVADTHRRMSDQDTTLRSFSEALGLQGEPSSDQILDAVRKLVSDKAAAETKASEAEGQAKEFAEQLDSVKADAKSGKEAAEELRVMRRERLFEEVIREKRVPPAELEGEAGEQLRKDYDASPDVVERMLRGRQPRTDLERQFGADPAPTDAEQQQAEGLALFPDPTGKAA